MKTSELCPLLCGLHVLPAAGWCASLTPPGLSPASVWRITSHRICRCQRMTQGAGYTPITAGKLTFEQLTNHRRATASRVPAWTSASMRRSARQPLPTLPSPMSWPWGPRHPSGSAPRQVGASVMWVEVPCHVLCPQQARQVTRGSREACNWCAAQQQQDDHAAAVAHRGLSARCCWGTWRRTRHGRM